MGEGNQAAEREKPLVLIVADADMHTGFYTRTVKSFGYNTISAFDEWDANPDLHTDFKESEVHEECIPHAGPLYGEFMESLARKMGDKYDAVVVDMKSADLIGSMKKGGYHSPFVICGVPLEKTDVPFVPLNPDEFKSGLKQKLAELIAHHKNS
jgi:hypothetical protein